LPATNQAQKDQFYSTVNYITLNSSFEAQSIKKIIKNSGR
jgi:hypothetical protein